MDEYIERKSVLQVVFDIMSDCKVSHKCRAINRNIKQIPAADVARAVHGQWIEDKEGILHCSECREEALYISTYEEQFDYDWEENLVPCGYEEHKEYIKTNYCPNCGARMDGDTK